ncbi:hypothetical protein [Escherichia coli]|uniref:Uncharacterized protein n=2 Tax=Rosemountvirus yarpen TaxID=2846142 RepID=A0A6G8RAK0_9CAUD|nr:hypothetical protein [Escherichia coli]YP_009857616.1 hypothetical protein HWD19_gp25 [Salmonella phage yarpen]QIN98388.1 hypothetical protein yarpen_25 [Salmonella phage yarpen]QIN98458.1 hypothetical protein nenneke_26 [Salmonella phage nenneke]QTI37348.1 hypothetical protein JJB22_26580 [Escherichia coli]
MLKHNGKKYNVEDRYRHHLGILKSIMRTAGMDEMEPLCNILPRVRHMVQDNAVLNKAIEQAQAEGVAFIRVTHKNDGTSLEVVNSRNVEIKCEDSPSDS